MNKVVSIAGCILALNFFAYADFTPIALTPDSYNHDVVVERTAPGPIQTLVTANMDAGTNIYGLFGGNGGNHGSFYETGLSLTAGSGLPMHGSLVNAVSDTNHVFRMPSNYASNNAVFIGGSQAITTQIASGSLTLATPGTFKKLSVLNAAGSGPATVSYTVQFQDGSSEQGTFVSYDWGSVASPDTNTTAVIANGYFQGSDASFRNVNAAQRSPRLFYNDLALVNSNGIVTRVDFSYTVDNRRVAIFGLSGSVDGTNFTPLTVTGFNRDMIIESPAFAFVSATPFGGTNKTDSAFYEVGFAKGVPSYDTTGLPHPGNFTAISNANITFQMMPYTSNNAVMLDSSFSFVSSSLQTPASYKKLALLATASGFATINYTVIHSDFSSTAGSIAPQSWIGSTATNLAFLAGGREGMDRESVFDLGNGGKLYYYLITLSSTTSVSAINFTHSGSTGARSMIFGVSGDPTGSGVFSPITIDGYNADLVLEKEAGTNIYTKALTTATVNGGTNNNNQSFYEKGWNTLAPGSGLPQANSVITSANLPDRQYQMAASYSLPNAIFVHTNAQVAEVTFANPTNYSALSFLATAGGGPVQIEVDAHFEGGSSETNTTVIPDWFSNGAAAYTMAGSVVADSRGASNWTPGTTSARLFDCLLPVSNAAAKMIGVTIRWTANNGSGGISGGSRPFILAVSGLIPSGSPALTAQPINSAAYSGSNAVLTVNANGALPLTYQWQASAIGSGVFTNISDGGSFSGANSSTLTLTGFSNTANYRVVISNTQGSITSAVARVTAVSTLPNILRTNDPVQIYGGTPSGIPTEGVTNAINGTLAKYLNFGLNSTAAPYEGPVGLTVTPGVGHTIVNILRVFAATDAPERDPADYVLEGSNDGGTNWTLISSNSIFLTDDRSVSAPVNPLTQNQYEAGFTNTTPYSSYRISFPDVKTNAIANSVQIGEVQLLGVAATNPPVITQDISSAQLIYIGDNLVLPTAVSSTRPFTFQWKKNGTNIVNGGNISGAQTNVLSVTSVGATNAGNYQLFVTNNYGSAVSTVDAVSIQAAPEFNGNGVGWALNGTINGASSPATISGNVLALTTGSATTVRGAFLAARQNVSAFLATYTYQTPSAGGADGVAFVLQNDPRGTAALGAAGGSLGASGITPSLEIEFNIYSPNVIGMAIRTNGATGSYQSTSPVNLASGHPINVTVTYAQKSLAVKLDDTTAGTSFSTNLVIDLPTAVGGTAAYVGFTGATGGLTSTQNILNFQFTSLPIITMQTTNNAALFSWPAIGGCVLQSNSDISSTNWVTVSDILNVTNATFQLNTTLDGNNKFYRLKVTNP